MVYSALITFAFLACAASASDLYEREPEVQLTVKTRTGIFHGGLNDTYPDVRQFKYIPYAKPPIGAKRWTSPEALDNSSALYESTVFGPSCSQYVSAIPSVWALNITGNLIVNYGESLLAGQVAQNSAEDCLTLAIWTPANATAKSNLPVILFMTGGGDVTGGINIPTQMPANWVHNSQSHIVVTINYRVNIFSFPNALGLNGSTNFGLQDQRKAVEWVSENIASFGGCPSKITLWGQSAGASAADMYLFSHATDPLIRASVSSSGLALGRALNEDYSGSNFSFVANNLGCSFSDPAVELECMRHVPMPRIENFVGQYQDNSTLVNTSQPAISFTRQVNNITVFANYTSLYLSHSLAPVPKIIGTTAREASALLPYPVHNASAGPSLDLITSSTLATVCAAYNTSVLRAETGLSTYRYEWAGNFTNISPIDWLGAYHYSDLYMFFGTYIIAPGVITELEKQTSLRMQELLLAFVRDPESLPSQGWPEYDATGADGGTLARFGAGGEVLQLVDGDAVAGACHIPGDVYVTNP